MGNDPLEKLSDEEILRSIPDNPPLYLNKRPHGDKSKSEHGIVTWYKLLKARKFAKL